MGPTLTEDTEHLDSGVLDRHRAINSVIEELEAVDVYDQRHAASTDETLRAILAHNRDEEKEHAAMLIEWLRRNDRGFENTLATYLYAKGEITEVEEEGTDGGATDGSGASKHADSSLGIGSLREDDR